MFIWKMIRHNDSNYALVQWILFILLKVYCSGLTYVFSQSIVVNDVEVQKEEKEDHFSKHLLTGKST